MPVNARHCLDLSDCWNEAYEAVKKLLSNKRNRPDALICFNDYVANDVLDAALDLGIRVPEDLELLCFDDIAYLYPLYGIPFRYVRMPLAEMTKDAMEYLSQRMEDPATPVLKRLYPVEIREKNANEK